MLSCLFSCKLWLSEKMDAKSGRRIGGKKITKIEIPYLPVDDIIPNILSRLPIKSVMRCRLVCRTWRDLTLTPDFIELHLRYNNTLPMIMVANLSYKNISEDYVLLDKWWELSSMWCKKLMIHKFQIDSLPHSCSALFSHAGLIVFQDYSGKVIVVCNPMDPENVITITLSKDIRWSEIYGVFFHPSRKEYCSLWMINEDNNWTPHPKKIKYKMLTLGSNPTMKTISNPFGHRFQRFYSSPLFIDKYLYWKIMTENDKSNHSDIMQFDILSEVFTVIPCPVPLDVMVLSFSTTSLLNVDGTLSFLSILPNKITICRLEDGAQQLWTTTDYTFSIELFQGNEVPKAIAVVEGKLAAKFIGRLIVYNLMQGTMLYCRKTQKNCHAFFLSHQMCLASLKNCASKICIDQEGEVVQKVNKG